MKTFGFWVLLLVLLTTLICLSFPPLPPDHGGASRKLKENMNDDYKIGDAGDINLQDYHRDPVPSSKASINHGPVQHGTPLNPYIPNLPPPGPNHPDHVDVVFP